MNKLSTIFLCLCFPFAVFSQCDEIYRIETPTRSFNLLASGFIANDVIKLGEDSLEFDATFRSNLWIAGLDPSGNLKLAGATYGGLAISDYAPGPINSSTNNLFENNCDYFDRVWILKSSEVESVKEAFLSGSLMEDNIPLDILEWPAIGNEKFNIGQENGSVLQQTLAPFYDHDGDGFYDVFSGDLPILDDSFNYSSLDQVTIPSIITFSVYNDNGLHYESQGESLKVEIQQINYMLDCVGRNSEIDQTLFTKFKIANKGFEDLRDLHIGVWEDADFICNLDNLQGCSPELNTSFTYNIENTEFCGGIEEALDANIGTIRSTILLDKTLSSFVYYNNPSVFTPPPATVDPSNPAQFFNYLNGIWLDGTPMTVGGNGYNPGSNDVSLFAFPGLPNDASGWNMASTDLPNGDRRTLTNIGLEDNVLVPGQMLSFDIASHITFDGASTTFELFDDYEEKINEVKDFYAELKANPNFLNDCLYGMDTANEDVEQTFEVDIYPNPAYDQIQIEFPTTSDLQIDIIDVQGRLLYTQRIAHDNKAIIQISDFAASMYFVNIIKDGAIVKVEKVIKY